MDCLVIGYSEPSRHRERQQFFNEKSQVGGGWRRYLHLNYVDFDGDFVLPNQLASLVHLEKEKGVLPGKVEGGFQTGDLNKISTWNVPLLGGLYVYQFLRRNGFTTELVKHVQMERELFLEALEKKPKVIAISTTLLMNPLDIGELIFECRKHSPESFIVLGGTSTWSEFLARKGNVNPFKHFQTDCIVLDSKGFKTLKKVIEHVKKGESLKDIPNLLVFKKENRREIDFQTPSEPEVFDFTTDTMDWDYVEDRHLGNITWVQTQVSCPFSCSFCSFPVIQGDVQKSDLASVEKTLEQLHKRGVRHLLFVDDTFNVPVNRFKSFLELLKKYEFTWYSYIRCQFLDAEQVQSMKDSGCGGVYLGIESANETVLKNMDKAVKPKKYWDGVKLLSDAGIVMYGSFLIGFPGETEESIAETTKFIQESGIDYYNIKCFYYDHSTPIGKRAEEFGLTGSAYFWKHDTMDTDRAFSAIQKIIQETEVTYIPQHSGELWELGYLRSLGASDKDIHALYDQFTKMMRLGYQGKKADHQQVKDSLKELRFPGLKANGK